MPSDVEIRVAGESGKEDAWLALDVRVDVPELDAFPSAALPREAAECRAPKDRLSRSF